MLPIILISGNKQLIADFVNDEKRNRTDLIIKITPDKTKYSIDLIKEIKKEIKISQPYVRIYLLENFDQSSLEAQNAFLKTLEESGDNIKFILTTFNIHTLLPTVISRSKIIYLGKKEKIIIKKNVSDALTNFINTKKLEILNNEDFIVKSKEDCLILINQLIVFFRSIVEAADLRPVQIIKELFNIKKLIESNNLNSQTAIDHLLFFIKNIRNQKIKKNN